MAPRKKAAGPAPQSVSTLLKAVEFIALAQKEIGAPYETHCRIDAGWITATNGVLSAGHPIQDDLQACPHSYRLRSALQRTSADGLSVTMQDTKLAVVSGKFRAHVDCLSPHDLAPAFFDQRQADIDDRIRTALTTVGVLASETGQHVLTASVLLQSGSAVGTDRHTIIEYWHGNTLPGGLAVPKAFIVALNKVEKKLAGFGYTENHSATFYFEDGAWLKTQLYSDPWPDISQVFAANYVLSKANPELATAIDAVLPFATNDIIYFKGNSVSSHLEDGIGASYEISNVPNKLAYDGKRIKAILPHAKKIDLAGSPAGEIGRSHMLVFQHDLIRGCVSGTHS